MKATFFCFLLFVVSSCYAIVHIGGALNVFDYFGYLGEVLRTDPANADVESLDYTSFDVFEDILETRSSFFQEENEVFKGDFNLELCDSASQLKAALFKLHKIEGCDRAWRAYTGGWSNTAAARHLGVNSSFITGPHGYVLVRLTRNHESVKLASPPEGLKVNNITLEHADKVIPGDVSSVMEFMKTSGSHYINSYLTGDSLFQVFVFSPTVYDEIQRLIQDYKESSEGIEKLLSFFSPMHAEHIGSIVSSSGNSSLESWAARTLQCRMFVFLYSNLLMLHSHPELLQDLSSKLGNNALLSAELRTLADVFVDGKRKWFEEVLDNHLKLWDLSV